MLKNRAKALDMDYDDFLYYERKQVNQSYEFWREKQYKKIPGAKIRTRNLKANLADIDYEMETRNGK